MSIVTVVVTKRNTIKHDGKVYKPGETSEMIDHEALELIRTGAAHRPGEEPVFVAQTVRPLSPAELAELPPGPVPIHPGTALGPRVFSR